MICTYQGLRRIINVTTEISIKTGRFNDTVSLSLYLLYTKYHLRVVCGHTQDDSAQLA